MSRALAPAVAAGASCPAARAVSYAGLGVIGLYIALVGPALGDLSRRTGASLGDTGALFTAIFGASMVSTYLAGRAVDRYGFRAPAALGLAINGLGLLLIPLARSYPALLGAGIVTGTGDGALVVVAHVLVAAASPGREAAALNRLNVMFGVGAIGGPALGAALRLAGVSPLPLFALYGGAQLVLAALILFFRLPAHGARQQPDEHGTPALRRAGLLWLLAALLLVYVGVEVGVGGWAFTYARESAGLGGAAATLLSSGFWAALTAGRLLSPLALRRLSPAGLLLLSAAISAAGSVLMVLGGSSAVLVSAGILTAGLGFGPVWPVAFAISARAFPATVGSASGILASLSAVGALGIPWAQGQILDSGGPAAGIMVTVAGCAVLIALAEATRRQVRR